MRSSGMSLSLPTRRCMMAGLIGIGAAPLQTVDPTAPAPAVTDAVLLTNLFTRIATHVRVNGERHVFVIDTGAERSAISDTVARGLDLIPDRPVMVHGITSAQLSPTVRINWLDFSGRRFADLKAPVFARAQLGADGLLGLSQTPAIIVGADILTRFSDVVLDYGRGQMTFGGRLRPSQIALTAPPSTRISDPVT